MLLKQILFLNEGLLKLPPVLEKEIFNYVVYKWSQKELPNIETKIESIKTKINKIENFKKNNFNFINNIFKHISQNKKEIKISSELNNFYAIINGDYVIFVYDEYVHNKISVYEKDEIKDYIKEITENFYLETVNYNKSLSIFQQKKELLTVNQIESKWEERNTYLFPMKDIYFLNWEYKTKNFLNSVNNLELRVNILDFITGDKDLGSYEPAYPILNSNKNIAVINIKLPQTVTIDSYLNLKTTVRHELGHFVQELLLKSKKNKYNYQYLTKDNTIAPFGIPSKKLSNEKERSKFNIVNHSLKDIEFYTNLFDEYDLIKTKIGSLNPEERLNSFKNYIKFSERFNELKINNIKKYNKYISLIYNQLDKEGFFDVVK